jgi:hypothetical protein
MVFDDYKALHFGQGRTINHSLPNTTRCSSSTTYDFTISYTGWDLFGSGEANTLFRSGYGKKWCSRIG